MSLTSITMGCSRAEAEKGLVEWLALMPLQTCQAASFPRPRRSASLRACKTDISERLVRVKEPQDQRADDREEEPFAKRKVVSVPDQVAGDVNKAEIDGE